MSQCRRNEEVKVKASKIKLAQARKIKAKTIRPSNVDLSGWNGAFKQGTHYCEKVKTVLLNLLQVSFTFLTLFVYIFSCLFSKNNFRNALKLSKHLIHNYELPIPKSKLFSSTVKSYL